MINKVLIVFDSLNANDENYNAIILKLISILKDLGIKAEFMKISNNLHEILEIEPKSMVFNLVPLIGSNYSWFLPALCDFLKIPYTGSGIFTISTLSNKYYEEILKYHRFQVDKSAYQRNFCISLIGNGDKMIYNINQFEKNDKTIIFEEVDVLLIEKIMKIVKIVKDSLRIYDYLTIELNKKSGPNGEVHVSKIIPSPDLSKNSQFCSSLQTRGLTYEEILAGILLQSILRYNIPLTDNFIQLNKKFTQLIEHNQKNNHPLLIERFNR